MYYVKCMMEKKISSSSFLLCDKCGCHHMSGRYIEPKTAGATYVVRGTTGKVFAGDMKYQSERRHTRSY